MSYEKFKTVCKCVAGRHYSGTVNIHADKLKQVENVCANCLQGITDKPTAFIDNTIKTEAPFKNYRKNFC